jgi:hypothetical protein
MAESVAEVIARLKAQKTSQDLKAKEQPKAKPKENEDYENAFEDEEVNQSQEKAVEKQTSTKNFSHQENPTNQQADIQPNEEEKVAMQIELLQNNGRYRTEMLFQMQEANRHREELNKTLTAIAGILVDIHGKIN